MQAMRHWQFRFYSERIFPLSYPFFSVCYYWASMPQSSMCCFCYQFRTCSISLFCLVILRFSHHGDYGGRHSQCIPSCSCLVAVMVTGEFPSLSRIFNSFAKCYIVHILCCCCRWTRPVTYHRPAVTLLLPSPATLCLCSLVRVVPRSPTTFSSLTSETNGDCTFSQYETWQNKNRTYCSIVQV